MCVLGLDSGYTVKYNPLTVFPYFCPNMDTIYFMNIILVHIRDTRCQELYSYSYSYIMYSMNDIHIHICSSEKLSATLCCSVCNT